jgi:hypothetical protein
MGGLFFSSSFSTFSFGTDFSTFLDVDDFRELTLFGMILDLKN